MSEIKKILNSITWTALFSLFLGALFVCFEWSSGFGGTTIEYKIVWKSRELIPAPPAIIGVSDLDGNGKKELFMTDFSINSRRPGEIDPQNYHFLLLEWDGKGLNKKWEKEWPGSVVDKNKYYDFFNYIHWVNVWKFGNSQALEAMAPFFHLEYQGGAFRWKEQYGKKDNRHDLVASWTFPFQSFSCLSDDFNFFKGKAYPYECVMAVRDFGPKIGSRVVSLVTKSLMDDPRAVKVRNPENNFKVEWEGYFPDRPNLLLMIDPFGVKNPPFVQYRGRGGNRWQFLVPKGNGEEYEVKTLKADGELWRALPIGLKEIKAGRTQNKEQWEYWGYRISQGYDERPIFAFQKTYPNREMTSVIKEDISFPTHDRFIGIGDFAIEDLDGDEIDEIIFIEETGVREGNHGYDFKNVADFIRVAKWTGDSYKIIWTSPAMKVRGSKVIVADLMGNRHKQIIVCSGDGAVEIWGKI